MKLAAVGVEIVPDGLSAALAPLGRPKEENSVGTEKSLTADEGKRTNYSARTMRCRLS